MVAKQPTHVGAEGSPLWSSQVEKYFVGGCLSDREPLTKYFLLRKTTVGWAEGRPKERS